MIRRVFCRCMINDSSSVDVSFSDDEEASLTVEQELDSVSVDPSRHSEFKEAFQMFDKDKDGGITVDELEMVMKLLDKSTTKKEVKDMFNEADSDGNGSIDFEEFLAMMARKIAKHSIQENMTQAFRVFDPDDKGYLSADDFRHVMTTYGDTLSKEETEEMITFADVNQTGSISYMEYVKEVSSTLEDID